MSGFAVAATLLGQPDIGLVTFTEMADVAGRIADVLTVPLLADADTGYGNALNVERLVSTYMRRGVAGLHIEDQVMPKRCGHLAGKAVVSITEMQSKITAAVDERARLGGDIVVVARTDARAVEGLDAALDRARAYREAGADLLFVEALESEAEVRQVADDLGEIPLVYNASAARQPTIGVDELGELGYSLVLAPITALLASAEAMQRELGVLVADGPSVDQQHRLMSYNGVLDLVDWPEVSRREKRYL